MGAPSQTRGRRTRTAKLLPPGYAGWIGRVSEIDSVIVEILYECGAVPFVRTNVPQTLQVRTARRSVGDNHHGPGSPLPQHPRTQF